jgi:hypothetical protein
MAERILTRPERMRARLATGCSAHLVAGLADWVALLRTLARDRRHGRRPA